MLRIKGIKMRNNQRLKRRKHIKQERILRKIAEKKNQIKKSKEKRKEKKTQRGIKIRTNSKKESIENIK